MTSVSAPVAYTLITLTGLGVLFYVGVVIAGAPSYECPFQTPGSALLGRLWTRLGPRLIPIALPVVHALRARRDRLEARLRWLFVTQRSTLNVAHWLHIWSLS